MNDPIFNPEYIKRTMRDIDSQRTQLEDIHQPALRYFQPEQLPGIDSPSFPPPSVEGQQIRYFIWHNAYFKSRTVNAVAVKHDGKLFWVYLSIQDEFWGKQRILT